MNTYGYCRVSTLRQADEGESLAVQERQVTGYAMLANLNLDQVFVERGVSGSKPLHERPAGKELLGVLQAGDTIITPKLDRMFRSALDALDTLARLKEQSIALHMIDLGGDVCGNGISKLVFTILSAVAEAERDRIRERVQTVKSDQKERGRYLGGIIPWGHRVGQDGALEPVDGAEDAIREMARLREEGASLRAVAAAMRVRGYDVSHEAVRGILARDTVRPA